MTTQPGGSMTESADSMIEQAAAELEAFAEESRLCHTMPPEYTDWTDDHDAKAVGEKR